MPQLLSNGVNLEYDVSGPKDGTPVLLIMGLASQLTAWPVDFTGKLNQAGYRTIRFDNRDIGLSEKTKNKKTPKIVPHMILRQLGIKGLAPYNLKDMAKDAVGILDHLNIERAHILGVSMGGMISQVLASEHPERVISLVPIMTSTNNRTLPRPSKEVSKMLLSLPRSSGDRDQVIDGTVAFWNVIGTKNSGSEPHEVRDRIEAAYDRSYNPSGPKYQISAIIDTGDLRRFAQRVRAPTLVIHGKADVLVPYQCGEDVARHIPHAKLKLIEDMGHDLPKKHISTLTDWIINHFKKTHSSEESQEAA